MTLRHTTLTLIRPISRALRAPTKRAHTAPVSRSALLSSIPTRWYHATSWRWSAQSRPRAISALLSSAGICPQSWRLLSLLRPLARCWSPYRPQSAMVLCVSYPVRPSASTTQHIMLLRGSSLSRSWRSVGRWQRSSDTGAMQARHRRWSEPRTLGITMLLPLLRGMDRLIFLELPYPYRCASTTFTENSA